MNHRCPAALAAALRALSALCLLAFIAGCHRPAPTASVTPATPTTAAPAVATASPLGDAAGLLGRVADAYHSARTLSARLTVSVDAGGLKQAGGGPIYLAKPNLLRADLRGTQDEVVDCDGKTLWQYVKNHGQYTQQDADPDGRNIAPFPNLEVFYPGSQPPDWSKLLGLPNATAALAGEATVGGRKFHLVRFTQPGADPVTLTLYIGPTLLIERMTSEGTASGQPMRTDVTLSDLHVGAPIDRSRFAFAPPPSAHPLDLSAADPQAATLLPVGAHAPPFRLPMPKGGQIGFAEALHGRRAVLINFWFHG